MYNNYNDLLLLLILRDNNRETVWCVGVPIIVKILLLLQYVIIF